MNVMIKVEAVQWW